MLPLRRASPSLGRMETPGVMSVLRPGTDQQEEEEPWPEATDSAAGPLGGGRRVAKAGWAAPRAGGRWDWRQRPPSLACRGEGALPALCAGAGRGRRGEAPQPEQCDRKPGTGRPLTFSEGIFCVCSEVFGVESQPGDKQGRIS